MDLLLMLKVINKLICGNTRSFKMLKFDMSNLVTHKLTYLDSLNSNYCNIIKRSTRKYL